MQRFKRGVARGAGPGIPLTPLWVIIYISFMSSTYKSYAMQESEESTWQKLFPARDNCAYMFHLQDRKSA